MLAGPLAAAQTTDSYWVNSGLNQQRDKKLGEFATDMGSHIPISAYDLATHHWQLRGCGNLRQIVLDNFLNLHLLDQALRGCASGSSGYPLPPKTKLIRNELRNVWWAPPSQPDYIEIWDYRINKGYARIIRRADPPEIDPVHILLVNYPAHFKDFGSFAFDGFPLFEQGHGWGDPGHLNTEEQAVERGDIVVRVTENLGADIFVALQRTQEAEWFVRNHFMPNVLLIPPSKHGNSYLWGDSWGGQVSGMLSLVDPETYAAAGLTFGGDIGFFMPGFGDWARLILTHFGSGTSPLAGPRGFDRNLRMTFDVLVDVLGIRWDHPRAGMQPWDVAIFSQIHRHNDIDAEVHGVLGSEDQGQNWHWQRVLRDPASPHFSPNFKTEFLKNTGHDNGISEATKNEVFFWDGMEWADLIALDPTPGDNRLVPLTPPPYAPHPDPYSHTLRHDICTSGCPYGLPLLAPFDLNPGSAAVDTIGQGVDIGRLDTMGVDDLDGDGKDELFFGNLDGYFHVMEISRSLGVDNPTVTDEWKSPKLGWGITAMDRDPGGKIFVGNSRGQIHSVEYLTSGQYQANLFAWPSAAPDLLDGVIHQLHRGDFSPDHAGTETLVLNHSLDWVLLDQSGQPLGVSRLWRQLAASSPGAGFVVNHAEGIQQVDASDELILPALDGHVWYVDWLRAPDNRLSMEELLPCTGRGLYRAVGIDEEEDGEPEYLLLIGVDDPEGAEEYPGASQPNRLLVYDLATSQEIDDVATGIAHRSEVSFAWVEPPVLGYPATFVLGGGNKIEKYIFAPPTGLALLGPAVNIPPLTEEDPTEEDEEEKDTRFVNALSFLPLPVQPFAGHVIAGLVNGRIWFLDQDLNFVRDASDVHSTILEPAEWYSNRSLGYEVATFAEPSSNETVTLNVAEFQHAFEEREGEPDKTRHYRMLQIKLDLGATPSVIWDEYVDEARSRTGSYAFGTRFLRYGDLDPNIAGKEVYTLAETGVVYPVSGEAPRQFCNRATDDEFLPKTTSGYLFEALDPDADDYSVLSGFFTPMESVYFQNSSNPEDWWYPVVGAYRIGKATAQDPSPQLASPRAVQGSSMTLATFTPPGGGGVPKDHIVTGTKGGYVDAVMLPDDQDPGDANLTPTTLSYHSPDLGWYVVGMDAGNLDADADDEIVVGTLIDDGTFDDWALPGTFDPNLVKNRGHLHILDPNPATGQFDVTTLTGDDLLGPRGGIGAGVFGVKIDDVDGDGTPEIWCGDAVGHLYLFRKVAGIWTTYFRSCDLAPYVGLYNNIHPVKDAGGNTIGLLVLSSGYLMAFEVDYTKL